MSQLLDLTPEYDSENASLTAWHMTIDKQVILVVKDEAGCAAVMLSIDEARQLQHALDAATADRVSS